MRVYNLARKHKKAAVAVVRKNTQAQKMVDLAEERLQRAVEHKVHAESDLIAFVKSVGYIGPFSGLIVDADQMQIIVYDRNEKQEI